MSTNDLSIELHVYAKINKKQIWCCPFGATDLRKKKTIRLLPLYLLPVAVYVCVHNLECLSQSTFIMGGARKLSIKVYIKQVEYPLQ